MDGQKEFKKLLRSDQACLSRALLNSIKKRDLLMFRCLIEEFKVDVSQPFDLENEKPTPTTFLLQAIAMEYKRYFLMSGMVWHSGSVRACDPLASGSYLAVGMNPRSLYLGVCRRNCSVFKESGNAR